MHSTKIAEYKALLEHVPDNWVLGKYVDFPTVIYMEFNSNKVPVLQVLSDVFSNYSLETGEKILDYVFFTHKNFQPLLDENDLLQKRVDGLEKRLDEVKAERNKLETLFKTIKEAYLRISGNIFTNLILGKKLKCLLESIV
jgi:hypothetical protein